MDLLDIWIPATNLGLVNLNDGLVGIFGYVEFPDFQGAMLTIEQYDLFINGGPSTVDCRCWQKVRWDFMSAY